MASYPLAAFGSRAQQEQLLPDMLSGRLLGAYCLSEPHAGSDPGAMITRAIDRGGEYALSGTKAWVTHGGQADFYTVFARTSESRTERNLVLPGGRGHARPVVRCARTQDGADGLAHDHCQL